MEDKSEEVKKILKDPLWLDPLTAPAQALVKAGKALLPKPLASKTPSKDIPHHLAMTEKDIGSQVFADAEGQKFVLEDKGGQLRRRFLSDPEHEGVPYRNLSELDVQRALEPLGEDASFMDQVIALRAASRESKK